MTSPELDDRVYRHLSLTSSPQYRNAEAIARVLNVDQHNVWESLQRLERAGLVRPSRRHRHVWMTEDTL
jgi:Mn-dependent DtxR family transcriptional regulator